ncbi:MAG: hypothetical protein ACM3X9_05300 [Bacillota bacterium]
MDSLVSILGHRVVKSNAINGSYLPARPVRYCRNALVYSLKGYSDPRSLISHNNWPAGVFPLRKNADLRKKPPLTVKETEFTKVQGTVVYEIPVGPVHAGIIEPGHFRFNVAGEPIINLEAWFYYVYTGLWGIHLFFSPLRSNVDRGCHQLLRAP